jgi:hypothetical protein
LLACVLTVVAAGCTPVDGPVVPPVVVSTARANAVPRTLSRYITPILNRLGAAYQQQDLGTLAGLISDSRLQHSMRSTMRQWLEEGVAPLRITLVSARGDGANRFIGNVEFWSDVRALPTYMIFVFERTKSGVRIAGTATGIRGTRYDAASWTLTRSAHFLIYHSPYQLAGPDVSVLRGLEAERSEFERKFGVKVATRIAYYLYPTQPMMAGMDGGACGTSSEYVGCALPYARPPLIHTIEWPSYHEPVHVYEVALEPPVRNGTGYYEPLFIAEGTAVALEDRQFDPRLSDYCSDLVYIPLDECARQAVGQTSPLNALSDKGFQKGNLDDEYLEAGSFVKYLILHYGFRRFGKFYYTLAAQPKDTLHDYDVAARTVYHTDTRALLRAWRAALCRSGC